MQHFDEFQAIFGGIYAVRTKLNNEGSSLTKEKEPVILQSCYELTKMLKSENVRSLYTYMRDNNYDFRMSADKKKKLAIIMAKDGGLAMNIKWHTIMIAYDNIDIQATESNFDRLFTER
jgi:hypothetical protein